MRHCRNLILPIVLACAAPAHATQVCAWMEETIEPYEEDPAAEAEDYDEPATEDYEDVSAVDDADVMTADSETAASAAIAAQAAAEAAEAAADAADAAVDAGVEEEYEQPGLLDLKLWLQADGDADFYYKMAGEGLVQDKGGSAHSPNSGTYVLSRGEASSPWGLGMTFYPPGRIDVIIEIHEWPEDIFSDEDTPLLASFKFARRIPEGETQPPTTLAARQCKDVTFPPRKD